MSDMPSNFAMEVAYLRAKQRADANKEWIIAEARIIDIERAEYALRNPVLSLRDQLAMAALTGLLAAGSQLTHAEDAEMSYSASDAMMEARKPK